MVRGLVTGIALALALASSDARASVSIAVTWDGLLHESTEAAVATPFESRSVWENSRIYTYTHVRVDRPVAGDLAAGGEVWIRTMGGVVGKIGQLVEGEAVLVPGQSSLLFLHPGPVGAFEVTARGQGQFPVVVDEAAKAAPHLVRSHAVGALLPPRAGSPRLAADVLHDRAVDAAAQDVAADWGRLH